MKCNSDGSSHGNPGQAAGDGIFRDYNGIVLDSFATYFAGQTFLYSELFGAIMSIEMDLSKGWQKLWQEGDSFFIV